MKKSGKAKYSKRIGGKLRSVYGDSDEATTVFRFPKQLEAVMTQLQKDR